MDEIVNNIVVHFSVVSACGIGDHKVARAEDRSVRESIVKGIRNLTGAIVALASIIADYTREAGVRSLERELGKLARKTVRDLMREKAASITIDDARLADYAGVRKYRYGETDEVGYKAAVDPVSMPDFHATIYAALGINPAKELVNASRPVPITDGGNPIAALFG